MRDFTISPERRRLFNGTVLLGHMASNSIEYDVLLPGSQTHLDSILAWLLTRNLVEISEKNFYRVSTLGHATSTAFRKRYMRVLRYFDVFSAVDLGSGEFALAHHSDFETEAAWGRFLADDRWEDLRVPVGLHLGADPVELVFAHFMQEGRFSFVEGGWEVSLLEGLIWNEIEEICRQSLTIDDLGYDDVSGEDVIAEVIEQGFLLVRELSEWFPEVMGHLARWAPSRSAPDWQPDDSMQPFWKTRWSLEVS